MSVQETRSDEELARAAGRGDAVAFEALYRRHRGLVLGLARRFAGPALAVDVAQEVFLYLLARLPDLSFRGRLGTFLYPVVKHVAAAARRRENRHGSFEGRDPAEPAARAPAAPEDEDLAAALQALPEVQREVVWLRFADGFSLEEIATTLSIPLGTVKSRLHHALEALRQHPRTRRYHED
jgi:RNA polymerase sigma-70 factor (ECF subfamily)